jgi:hypothetical protein
MEARSDVTISRLYLRYLEDAMKIYGATASQVVFWRFEKDTGLMRSEIYLHPERFVQALQSIFGVGYSLIAKVIISRFKQMIPGFESSDLLEALRRLRRYLNETSNPGV